MVDDFSKDNSLEVAWLYAGQKQMYGGGKAAQRVANILRNGVVF